ncbi:PLP-dependent aminotransferase family protein [Alcaligenaceae bacterium]|nr:PLP-dependent aminotransferase family protein [Alcaligenaceae bacterium]
MTKQSWAASIPSDASPKYIALADAIGRAIEAGDLKPGDRLPTNRELSQLFSVTIATVTKGMAVASRRGLITAQVGNGTFVADRSAPRHEIEAMDLSLNVVPQTAVSGELSRLLDTLNASAVHDSLFGYGSYAPSDAHSRLAVEWMRSFGVDAKGARPLLTTGVHQGLLASFLALLKPGESAVCEDLTYTGIRRIAGFRDVRLQGVALDHEGILPDHLEERLKKGNARVVVLTPTLHNPTTATMSLERRRAVARLCRKYDAYLVEDGVNMPIAGELHPPVASFIPDRAILLTGYSKCVASGFRLGYAIVPAQLQQAFLEGLVSMQWTGPHLYSKLAENMLREGFIGQFAAAHRAEASLRYELARQYLPNIRAVDKHAYHAWVDCRTRATADNFAIQALRRGVKVSPAAHFAVAADGSSATSGYRISLGSCADRDALERALIALGSIDENRSPASATLI